MQLYLLVFVLFISLCYSTWAISAQTVPPLMLARVYQDQFSVSEFLVSEKLDGVRAYWDGSRLLTRSGRVINAPSWFLENFPSVPLDGELWTKRGEFDHVSGTIRKKHPISEEWLEIRYFVFDLPETVKPFAERYHDLNLLIENLSIPWVKVVEQQSFSSQQSLFDHLHRIVDNGGEGLMLHQSSSLYHHGRTNQLLKLKPVLDSEAKVIAHLPGQGKYENQLGALLVKDDKGKVFRIGTGFTDKQRQHPPSIGTTITFEYNGYTKNGFPRFARFLRVRNDI